MVFGIYNICSLKDYSIITILYWDRRDRDRMVHVQPVPITTKVVNSNPVHGEVYSIQRYVIKFVSDLRQVGGFLRFLPPIELTATV
jgi:hypothetical protein